MSTITIGRDGGREPVDIGLVKLLRTRLLLEANSGGGKSYALRKIAEEAYGKVPVIIIDPEGEFATLREKYGFVLVGKGGDTPADCRSAELVARRLLELRASAVCDLFDMEEDLRHVWIQRFFAAMLNAPKELWGDVLVILDEAHVYAPEKGEGESVAKQAVKGMATRGRKRGYGLVVATQRPACLDKSVAALMQNVVVGQMYMDVDQERAAKQLGIRATNRPDFYDEVRGFEPGTFYALGPAISRERLVIHVDKVNTTHPEAGSSKHAATPPPAPAKIRHLLPKLSDLPAEAEEEAKTTKELQAKVRELKAQLAAVPVQKVYVPKTETKIVVKSLLKKSEQKRMIALGLRIDDAASKLGRLHNDIGADLHTLESLTNKVEAERMALQKVGEKLINPAYIVESEKVPGWVDDANKGFQEKHRPGAQAGAPAPKTFFLNEEHEIPRDTANGNSKLSGGERKVLTALAQYPEGLEKVRLAVLTGYDHSAGGFNNIIGSLRTKSCIDGGRGSALRITTLGHKTLGPFTPLPNGTALKEYWLGKLDKAEAAILNALWARYPQPLSKEAIAQAIRQDSGGTITYAPDGGGFNNAMGRLRTFALIEGYGQMKACSHLF